MKTCEFNDLRHNRHYHIMPYALGSAFWKKRNRIGKKRSEIRINLGTDIMHIIKGFKIEALPIKNSIMMQLFKH